MDFLGSRHGIAFKVTVFACVVIRDVHHPRCAVWQENQDGIPGRPPDVFADLHGPQGDHCPHDQETRAQDPGQHHVLKKSFSFHNKLRSVYA
jgi:hypothetical protein